MNNAEALRIAGLVQDRLRSGPGPVRSVRVLADEVAREAGEETWYVPVSLHRDPEFMGLIYGAFSSIEEELERDKGLFVLIVPRIVPFQRWAEIA